MVASTATDRGIVEIRGTLSLSAGALTCNFDVLDVLRPILHLDVATVRIGHALEKTGARGSPRVVAGEIFRPYTDRGAAVRVRGWRVIDSALGSSACLALSVLAVDGQVSVLVLFPNRLGLSDQELASNSTEEVLVCRPWVLEASMRLVSLAVLVRRC